MKRKLEIGVWLLAYANVIAATALVTVWLLVLSGCSKPERHPERLEKLRLERQMQMTNDPTRYREIKLKLIRLRIPEHYYKGESR